MAAEMHERLIAHRVALVSLVKLLELKKILNTGELGLVLDGFCDARQNCMEDEITLIVESVDTDLGWTPTLIAGGKDSK